MNEAPRRSIRRNISSALIGNATYTAAQFGMLAALARLTTPLEVGRYGLALAITAPIFLLVGLKLRQVQVTDAMGANEPGEYYGLRMISSAVGLVAVVAVVALASWPMPTVLTILAVAASKALEAQVDIFYGSMQRREQLQLVARSQVFRGVAGLVVFVALLATTERVELAAFGLVGVAVVQVLTNAQRVRSLGISIRPVFTRRVLLRLATLALPLGVSVALGSLIVNVPRYFIEGQLGTSDLGVYVVLGYALTALGMIAASMAEAASPRLANLYARGEGQAFRSTLWKLVLVGFGLGVVGLAGSALFGRVVLQSVFGAQYAEQLGVLLILMAAAAIQFTSAFLGTSINAMRFFKMQAPLTGASLVTVLVVAAWAVSRYGLAGAAVAALAGQVVQAAGYAVILWKVVLPRLRGGVAA